MTWLPGWHPSGHYREQLERAIRKLWKVGQDIPIIEALPYGILLGDVVVKMCGAKWRYSKWTPGELIADDIVTHVVVLSDKNGQEFQGRPISRVGRFVADPNKTLTSFFDGFDALARGELTLATLKQSVRPGTDAGIVDLSPESIARYKVLDEKEEKE
jgi:hypothetical protein